MPMSVATLDALEKDFTPSQARTLTRVLEAGAEAHRAEWATKADLAHVAQDIKSELKAEIAALRHSTSTEVREAKVDGMRFTLLTMFGQVAMLAGIVYFLLEHVR